MAAYTLNSPQTSTPRRIQIRPSSPVQEEEEILCSGHKRPCKRFVSGAHTKNANRAFYVCPIPQGDPSRCKFFLWEDEIPNHTKQPPHTPHNATLSQGSSSGSHTLGRSPQNNVNQAPHTPQSIARRKEVISISDDEDDGVIPEGDDDWSHLDLEKVEKDAITSSQNLARIRSSQEVAPSSPGAGFNARLQTAMTGSKRAREYEDEEAMSRSPKKAVTESFANPFLARSSAVSPPHPKILPSISCLEQLSEDLTRQDRLLAANDQMKQRMRTMVKDLQDKNQALEKQNKEIEPLKKRIKELEAILTKNGLRA